MKIDIDDKTDVLTYHKKLLAEALKEKEDLKTKVENWQNSFKNLNRLLNTQISANDKFGLGYGDCRYDNILSYENEVLQSVFMNKECDLENTPVNNRYAERMHTVPPPMTGNYMPFGSNIEIDYSKFTYGPKQTSADESNSKPVEYASSDSDSSVEPSTSVLKPVVNESKVVSEPKAICEPKVWTNAPIIEDYESDSDDYLVFNVQENIEKPSFAFTDFVKHDDPHKALKGKRIVDSGCSRHMTGNKAHFADYEEFKGDSVAFGGSNGRITSKGKIKAGRLDFKDVYYVEELKRYNLFSVSQICDKKNKVLFTDTGCLVLSPDFKLPDENQVLLKSLDNTINQANKSGGPREANNSAGTQANDDQGTTSKEIDLHDEHFVLPIWSAYSTTVKSSKDKIQKTTDCKTSEKPVSQEPTHETEDVNTNNTNLLNVVSALVSAVGPSRALNNDEPSYTDDPLMPHHVDIYASPSAGIFTDSSYDDEGVVTDFNNLETTVTISPTPTTRIDTIHPKTQILRDPLSVVQKRSKVHKNSEAHALVSYIQKQQRNNHEDFQHCLFACFLSQIEPKKISQALEDKNLPFGKKEIGTKWVYRNKKDERGVIVRNKACLVAQGHRQEEEIDYDKVFALVARIEAIRIFLAFASYMGFIIYQMDVKSAFLYGTINEEVYVIQPPIFLDPKFPNKVYKVVKALYGLHQAPRACVKSVSTLIETQKPLVKDEEAADVDVHLYRSMIGSLMYLTASRLDIMFAVCTCSRFQTIVATSTIEAEYVAAAHCSTLLKGRLLEVTNVKHRSLVGLEVILLGWKIFMCWFLNHTSKGYQFMMSNPHQELASPGANGSCKELASPKQMSHGKDESNLLIVDSLLKTIWSSMHHVIKMKHWLFQSKRLLRVGTGFFAVITSLFENMLVPTAEDVDQQLPLPSNDPIPTAKDSLIFQELIDLCTRLSNKVLDLESKVIDIMFSFTDKIVNLKDRVHNLEDENRVLKEKSFKSTKVDIAAPVEDKEESFKQERMIADIDEDVEDIDKEEPAEVEEVLEVVTVAKLMTEVVTAGAQVPKASALRRKRVLSFKTLRRQQHQSLCTQRFSNDVIEQMKRSERQNNDVMRYQALKKPLTEAQARNNMMIYLKNMAGFKMNFFKGMNYSEIRPLFEKHYNSTHAFLEKEEEEVIVQDKEIKEEGNKRQGESLEQEIAKKQRMDKKAEELKRHLQIVANDDNDVYT
nr:hypothetical protein [Tanacetum cinerariifolium]